MQRESTTPMTNFVTEYEIGALEVPCGPQRSRDKGMHTNVDAGVESMCSGNVQATEGLLATAAN
jgi:hypothetical protein